MCSLARGSCTGLSAASDQSASKRGLATMARRQPDQRNRQRLAAVWSACSAGSRATPKTRASGRGPLRSAATGKIARGAGRPGSPRRATSALVLAGARSGALTRYLASHYFVSGSCPTRAVRLPVVLLLLWKVRRRLKLCSCVACGRGVSVRAGGGGVEEAAQHGRR